MNFLDRAEIAGTRRTADGYMVADVRCARTGVQQYTGAEVGRPDLASVNVYRPESTVFDRASLATYAGKPVTIGHPSVPVNAENWKKYAVGDVGMDIARDGEFVRVPLKLMDFAAINAVQGGQKEISMGYSVEIEWESGIAPDGSHYDAIQKGPLRINHLAIVEKARGGDQLRIGDSMNNARIYQDNQGRWQGAKSGADDAYEAYKRRMTDAWQEPPPELPKHDHSAQVGARKANVSDAEARDDAFSRYMADMQNAWNKG